MHPNQKHFRTGEQGFTLIEITIAMAIFAVTIGVAAQGMISFYAIVDMQNQRVVAMNECRATLSQMRNARTTSLANVIAQFPAGSSSGPAQLRSSTRTIAYESVTANPLVATITMAWRDLRGRAMNVSISTALTDQ